MNTNFTAGKNPSWVKAFAKIGLISKGIVYCLTGLLTLLAAVKIGNTHSEDADKGGIFKFIYDQPVGKTALALIAAGLLCYAVWRFILAIKDTEHKGNDAKGLMSRFVYFFSGLMYLSISAIAIQIAFFHKSGTGNSRQKLAGELLQQPFGKWLAIAVAIGMVVVGIIQIHRSVSGKYKKYVQRSGDISHNAMSVLIKSGKAGYIARGIVWLIIGWLFFNAAIHANASEAGNSGNAFEWLQTSSYGNYLLAAVSLGLICYGIFMFVRARYQPIHQH
jgi:hypothetical protein